MCLSSTMHEEERPAIST